MQCDGTVDAAAVEALIGQRNQARKNKDWAASDRIRNQLTEMGVTLEDSSQGTLWRKM